MKLFSHRNNAQCDFLRMFWLNNVENMYVIHQTKDNLQYQIDTMGNEKE